MNEQDNAPKRICADCGREMKFDGVQRMAQLGYEYDLHTCENDKCKLYTFTYSGPKRPIKEKN